MSERIPVCTGQVYRGYVLITLCADGDSRVVAMAPGQAARLFECENMSEACALVDATLKLEAADRLPVNGGARATVFVDGPMQTV